MATGIPDHLLLVWSASTTSWHIRAPDGSPLCGAGAYNTDDPGTIGRPSCSRCQHAMQGRAEFTSMAQAWRRRNDACLPCTKAWWAATIDFQRNTGLTIPAEVIDEAQEAYHGTAHFCGHGRPLMEFKERMTALAGGEA